jgi:hypothetical protein
LATERLSMRKIREILRQKWALGRTHREVAQSLSIALGTVSGVERRARAAGLRWSDVEGLADEVIETRLYPPGPPGKGPRPWPDCGYLHAERRKPGVTLELLHLEYLEQHPDRGSRRRWRHNQRLCAPTSSRQKPPGPSHSPAGLEVRAPMRSGSRVLRKRHLTAAARPIPGW